MYKAGNSSTVAVDEADLEPAVTVAIKVRRPSILCTITTPITLRTIGGSHGNVSTKSLSWSCSMRYAVPLEDIPERIHKVSAYQSLSRIRDLLEVANRIRPAGPGHGTESPNVLPAPVARVSSAG